MKKALFIGRFQPFHLGHLSDVKLALKDFDEVIIAIGSSQESGTSDNPFSYEERKEMIEKTLRAHKIVDYEIIPVPDINDDEIWVDHVKRVVGDFDMVYTGNDFTERLFKKGGMKVRGVKFIQGINATEIRKRIVEGNDWKKLVPKEVAEYIKKIEGAERVKGINGPF